MGYSPAPPTRPAGQPPPVEENGHVEAEAPPQAANEATKSKETQDPVSEETSKRDLSPAKQRGFYPQVQYQQVPYPQQQQYPPQQPYPPPQQGQPININVQSAPPQQGYQPGYAPPPGYPGAPYPAAPYPPPQQQYGVLLAAWHGRAAACR